LNWGCKRGKENGFKRLFFSCENCNKEEKKKKKGEREHCTPCLQMNKILALLLPTI
jgi:hypothetical protein